MAKKTKKINMLNYRNKYLYSHTPKKRNKTNKKYNIRNMRLKITQTKSLAGRPIAAGGFGCVFKPALTCKNYPKYKKYQKNYVSKLMLNRYADEEMSIINNFLPYIRNIKNYKDYFLIDDIYSCQPASLKSKDLKDFNKTCKNFGSYDKNNINDNIGDFKIINALDGGIDLDIYWNKWNNLKMGHLSQKLIKNKLFYSTNNSLIKLLNKGIIPMNSTGIYHLDIKGSNILRSLNNNNIYNIKDVKTRIIDWGLAMYKPNNVISLDAYKSRILLNRPFQFNLPFSNILLQTNIQEDIDFFISKYFNQTQTTTYDNTRNIICENLAIYLYDNAIIKLGDGHINYMIGLLNMIYKPIMNNLDINHVNIEKNIIIDYNKKVLDKYLDSKYKFNIEKYINEVFLKNVDIWGFIMSYTDIISLKNPWTNKLQSKICNILIKYCFHPRYSINIIPISELTNDLIKLNQIKI